MFYDLGKCFFEILKPLERSCFICILARACIITDPLSPSVSSIRLVSFSFSDLPLNREGAIQHVVKQLHDRDVVVGTTGMLSRELFELREGNGQGHEKDFLTVGSMGHASAIALGVAMQKSRREVTYFS